MNDNHDKIQHMITYIEEKEKEHLNLKNLKRNKSRTDIVKSIVNELENITHVNQENNI